MLLNHLAPTMSKASLSKHTYALVLLLSCLLISAAGCDDDGGEATSSDTLTAPDTTDGDASSGDTTTGDASDVADVVTTDPNIFYVNYDPEGDGFYRFPWPSDARLTALGTPDLSDFPNIENPLLESYQNEIEARVDGFSTMPVAYITLDKVIRSTSLPQINTTLNADSAIQMIDLSAERCGERIAVETTFNEEGDIFLEDNLLMIAPAIGRVLRPSTPYAVVVLDTLGEAEGKRLERPARFAQALADDAGSDAVSASLAPLRECLPQTGLDADDIAVATVFTTQDPIGETRALRDAVMDPTKIETRAIQSWMLDADWSRDGHARTYTGTFETPIFQDGDTPYRDRGGALIFDDQGEPVVQRWEEVPMALTLPDPLPEGPIPVLVFIDGTGWNRWTHIGDNWTDAALAQGFAIASFMPQFHGGRADFTGDTDISTFNFFNPPAGRSNFRQQAAETSYFVRVIREQIAGMPGLPTLATDQLVYGGHSQGALCGAIVASIETEYKAYVLNGLSAYLTLTILERKDPADYEALLKATFRIRADRDLDRFYPLLQVAQLGAESVDTHNYVPYWKGWEGNPDGNHVFVINGLTDHTSAPRGMDQLTITADLTPMTSTSWEPDPYQLWGMSPIAPPVQGNSASTNEKALTLATYLDVNTGHFTIYQRRATRDLSMSFWSTSLDGVPVLDYSRESLCSDGIDDDHDGLTDCDDPDCEFFNVCIENTCDDGEDEDNDGDIDCADADCDRSEPCVETKCEDGEDGDSDGDIDCADADCANHTVCLEVICDDGADDDSNGLTDCDDLMCLRDVGACPTTPEVTCDDGVDDDSDGLTDCDDPDCALSCANTTCADGDLGTATGLRMFAALIDDRPDSYPPGDCVGIGSGAGSPDIALHWEAPSAGDYVFSTEGSSFDTTLSLYPGDCASTLLACGDDHRGSSASRVVYTVEAGVEYLIVISSYKTSTEEEPITGVAILSVVENP